MVANDESYLFWFDLVTEFFRHGRFKVMFRYCQTFVMRDRCSFECVMFKRAKEIMKKPRDDVEIAFLCRESQILLVFIAYFYDITISWTHSPELQYRTQ